MKKGGWLYSWMDDMARYNFNSYLLCEKRGTKSTSGQYLQYIQLVREFFIDDI